MTKQTRKTRSQEFFSATVPTLLRGMAVFLLFTNQAWAGVVCCGANDIESQQSCHQSREEHRTVVESSEHYIVALAKDAKPSIEACFAVQSQEVPWCCQFSLPAEPQRPITSASNKTPLRSVFTSV